MRIEKIANRQLWFLLFLMRSTIILAYLPVLTSADALQDAWISAIVTLFGSQIFILLIALLATKFPDKTIIQYSQLLLGYWPGKLFSLVFLWLFLQLSVVDIRIYSEVLITGFLPQTPIIFISGIMVFAATICVQQGIEVLGRTADVLFILFVFRLVGVVLVPLGEFDIHNLQPVFVRGWGPVLRGALTPIALISQAWVLGILTPATLTPKKVIKTAMTAEGASLAILILVAIITIGVLSPQEGARATFPLLTLIRSVQITYFLQRMEVLVIFSWGFGLFISVSTFLYSGAKGFAQWLKIEDYRILLWPMAVIWVFMAVGGFEDIFALYEFFQPDIFAPYGLALLIFPLALLWLAYLLRNTTGKIKGD